LSAQIRSGKIALGAKLPTEAEIIAAHGVSRTVVREAISRLSAQGVVVTRHGIGTFVSETGTVGNFLIDPSELGTVLEVLAVLELRISLESEAAGLAAERCTAAQLKGLRRDCDKFATSITQGAETIGPDFAFHLHIAESTGNRYFAHLMDYLGTMIIPRTRVNTANLAGEDRVVYLQRVCSEHEAIYAAIARRDAGAARTAMRTHLSNSRERLRRAHAAATRAARKA
jgi:DNA-binding FadR family transcriptional regulator